MGTQLKSQCLNQTESLRTLPWFHNLSHIVQGVSELGSDNKTNKKSNKPTIKLTKNQTNRKSNYNKQSNLRSFIFCVHKLKLKS